MYMGNTYVYYGGHVEIGIYVYYDEHKEIVVCAYYVWKLGTVCILWGGYGNDEAQ